ncbi:Hypothetical predicted protein [Mytilus galloprovincialis]|uniref:Uncharacterized protein n=1 Tax=Mytilus galloprovincialis TaxID=29158 RepID=A0A8B6FS26_MYTGA|nr:Hypothetical predicted protein [Mytilus galloprovincialis]
MKRVNKSKSSATKAKGVSLQIVGMLFKVKKNGKVSEEHMNTVSDLTDEITTLMDDVNHNADSVKTNLTKTDEELKEAQKKIEGLKNENLSLRKEISQERRDQYEAQDECKKLKRDLDYSQEVFHAKSFDEDMDDLNDSAAQPPYDSAAQPPSNTDSQ